MCKVLMMAGINNSNRVQAWKFVTTALNPMIKDDKDGVGYAAVGKDGLFGERWLKPKQAFKDRQNYNSEDMEFIKSLGDAIESEVVYNAFGKLDYKNTTAIILHTRMKTNGAVELMNTHPFVRDNTALIHNGVISNQITLKNLTSTCDSECILNEYVESKVDIAPKQIEEVASSLQGYYACGVLTQSKDRWVMDVFKNSAASLHVCRIPNLGLTVFATNPEILVYTAKKCKLKLSNIFAVKDGRLIRIDTVTGHTVSISKFDARYRYSDYPSSSYPSYESKYSDPDDESYEDAYNRYKERVNINRDFPSIKDPHYAEERTPTVAEQIESDADIIDISKMRANGKSKL